MALKRVDSLRGSFEEWMKHPPTEELVIAVEEGVEAAVKSTLAMGAYPKVLLPTIAGVSWCLVTLAAHKGHNQLLPCLLQAGLNIEGGGTADRTPLMEAAAMGHNRTVETLLTLGANPLVTDSTGRTALYLAALHGHQQCVAVLMPVFSPIPEHLEAPTPVHAASFHGHVEVLEQLADVGWPITGMIRYGTPLHHAVAGGSMAAVQWLVQRGADPHVQDVDGDTALDWAVTYGRHEVETWLAKNGGEMVRDESHRVIDVREWRRIHEDNHNEVLSWLVAGNEADIARIPEYSDGHVLSMEGLTPLHAAALFGASSGVVEALLQRGVNPHVITPDNMTPADLARQRGHIAVIKGLQWHHCEQDDTPPEHLHEELLTTISRGDDVQAVSSLLCKGAPMEPLGGRSALRLAVTNDRARTVSLLLARGASLSASLLQEAWQSPSVTTTVLATLTTAYCCRLRAELRRLGKVSRAFFNGIKNLLKVIEGNSPWQAAWRWGKDTDRAALSDLLTKAAAANCPVTAAFLQRAGAWPFFSRTLGGSALHAALEAGHQGMVEVLTRDLGGSPYVPDTHGRLAVHMMTDEERRKLDQKVFEMERTKLENLELRQKGDRDKMEVRKALYVQNALFGKSKDVSAADNRVALLLASRKGFLHLTHLILQEGLLPIDEVLDDTCDTTALHQAASHGQDGCVALLLSAGANAHQRDIYGQTPRLLAAMFGHTSTCDLLAQQEVHDSPCRAGTTAKQVKQNFKGYHKMYYKYSRNVITPFDRHYPERIIKKLIKSKPLRELQQEAQLQQKTLDLSRGEALEVKEAVMAELNVIMENVSKEDPTYRGNLSLVGSSGDGSKLYAPDEFDVNIVIHHDDIRVIVSEREKKEALLKGRLRIAVEAKKEKNMYLQGNKFMDNLYEEVHRFLVDHTLQDERLSLVPPGLTSTQVGVALALAWQGQEYPLLLVGVDLVPVLEVPWQEQIPRPLLTPEDTSTMQLSNAADGSWRCSFALTEAKVLGTLSLAERQVQLMGKLLLSRLKAERWMPRHKKSFCTWFFTREWSIAVPSGFCFKNAFLRWLEHRRYREKEPAKELEVEWKNNSKELRAEWEDSPKELRARHNDPTKEIGFGWEDTAGWLVYVFRLMCANPEESREHLITRNSSAYFGGDCEGLKSGDGAPVIVQCLEENLEELCHGSFGQRDLSKNSQAVVRNILDAENSNPCNSYQ